MTIAHRVRVPIDSQRRIVVELPEEFDGTEAEVIVLAERVRPGLPLPSASGEGTATQPPERSFDDFLKHMKEFGRGVPAIPLEAMSRDVLYGDDE